MRPRVRVHHLVERAIARSTGVPVLLAGILLAGGCGHPLPRRSTLVHATDGAPRPAPWGEWRPRVRTDTSAGLSLSLFTLAPGQAPHPPHKHVEEELMILVSGTGVWHLAGQDSAAAPGDVVYAAPWDMHGLRNSGTTPLSYYVLKRTAP
jgi:mannose-6-phosphate isomerase-like protein (cupin superfamily)